jgi:hypothetical protein
VHNILLNPWIIGKRMTIATEENKNSKSKNQNDSGMGLPGTTNCDEIHSVLLQEKNVSVFLSASVEVYLHTVVLPYHDTN